MSRLVALDLTIGRRVRLNGTMYRVSAVKKQPAELVLSREDGADGTETIAYSELVTRFVLEQAELVDPTEDPDIAATIGAFNLCSLTPVRQVDWFHKMLMLRHLIAFSGMSHRSKKFREEWKVACNTLMVVRRFTGTCREKRPWSAKTLYDNLHRWRRANYAVGAFQDKGLSYRPWQHRDPIAAQRRPLIRALRKEYPQWSHEQIRRAANVVLKRSSKIPPDTSPTKQSTSSGVHV